MAPKPSKTAKRSVKALGPAKAGRADDLPFEESIGYQIRMTHRTLQRLLQMRIEPYGITLGMWYFLRALWNEDGLTQRELSRRTGTTEPTALIAIQGMEKRGLVRRVRARDDKRKWHVHLTAKGSALKRTLIPLARDVVATAQQGLSRTEMDSLMRLLSEVQKNLRATIIQLDDMGIVTAGADHEKRVVRRDVS